MAFLANSKFILQIPHAKTIKIRYSIGIQTIILLFVIIVTINYSIHMCGSNFDETHVSRWVGGSGKMLT